MEEGIMQQSGIDGEIKVEFKDNIAVLRIYCGENRLNPTFFDRMNRALDEVERNPNAHVLVTTGEGKFYSNGIDLDYAMSEMSRGNDKLRNIISYGFNSLIARILTFPMPTVACVNGHAYAGGAILAICHDYIVMREDRGYLCVNEIHLGLYFNPFLVSMLHSKLPGGYIWNEVVVLGKKYSGKEALQAGLVRQLLKEKDLESGTLSFAKQTISQGPYKREAMHTMKNDLYEDAVSKRLMIQMSSKI